MTKTLTQYPKEPSLRSVHHAPMELKIACESIKRTVRLIESMANSMSVHDVYSVHINGDDLHTAMYHLDYLASKLEHALPERVNQPQETAQ